MQVKVYNITGAETGEIELNDDIFGIKVNEAVLHQAVVMQMANRRQGNAATKTRAMVSGGGRKPWRQKGTGRARAGSIRSPLWVGGGVTFGPKPRSYAFTMPRKARRLALKSALSAKMGSDGIMVMDSIEFNEPKTKNVVAMLDSLKIVGNKTLIITDEENVNVKRSSSNIPGVKNITSISLNVIDILHHDKVLITKGAVGKIEEVLA